MVGKRIFFFNVTVRTVFNSCNDYTWLYNIYYIYNIIFLTSKNALPPR